MVCEQRILQYFKVALEVLLPALCRITNNYLKRVLKQEFNDAMIWGKNFHFKRF